ncbi:MAG: glycoside hydrolase family 88 protein [Planctomycetaceae bacterium]|nr:glycoside hydrolase family 88 protein [Planctomycetaceae bacterium]
MLKIDHDLTPSDLLPAIERMWEASAQCIDSIDRTWDPANGSPVFTIEGRYTAQGWTEWTQGFQFGAALLQFDGTDDRRFVDLGRRQTWEKMAPHVTHIGVHDHGFNNISTYGNLRRLMLEGRIPHDAAELAMYELALKCSGAVQAARWTATADGGGFIHSFNGPHSLFCDTIRSLRSLALAHWLGHRLLGENDLAICLLDRLVQHAEQTANCNVYYGEGRDAYDVRGRVAHESIFNTKDGRYRCPSTQQGYSPFTTWTRGLAWIMLGYPELLEYLAILPEDDFDALGGRSRVEVMMLEAATAACDFFIENVPTDGVPYWDSGAPRLVLLGEYTDRPSDPFNGQEPVDSSAAAIGCQGLLRLGRVLTARGDASAGSVYFQAGLTVLRTLLDDPYLSTSPEHQGLLLHSVYHRPRGWDHIPEGHDIPCGESCLWGDYHLLESALCVQRIASSSPYLTFFGPGGR